MARINIGLVWHYYYCLRCVICTFARAFMNANCVLLPFLMIANQMN